MYTNYPGNCFWSLETFNVVSFRCSGKGECICEIVIGKFLFLGGAAERAGLHDGDRIIRVSTKKTYTFREDWVWTHSK